MIKWLINNLNSIILSILFFGIFYFFNKWEKESHSYYSYIFLYFVLYTSSNLLPNWIIFKQIKYIIAIPGSILILVGPLIQVFLFITVMKLIYYREKWLRLEQN